LLNQSFYLPVLSLFYLALSIISLFKKITKIKIEVINDFQIICVIDFLTNAPYIIPIEQPKERIKKWK